MGVDHFACQTVGIDGVAQLVGIAAAVLVDREQIQLVFALQDHGISVAQQEIIEKAQIEMGVIGQQQGVSSDHFRDIPGDSCLGQALFPEVLGGNAGQLLDFRRNETARGQGDELVILPDHGGHTVHPFHHRGGELDDLIPVEEKACGLGVKDHQPVIFGK